GRDAVAFIVRQPEIHELLPGVLYLRNLGHIGHGAARVQVGEDDRLSRPSQYVGAFRHEVYAAEHDVTALGLRSHLREAVGIAAIIGETHHFIALIMVTQDDALAA